MALSFARFGSVSLQSAGDVSKKMVLARVTFDSSYPSNGEAVTAADFGLSSIDVIISIGASFATGGGDTGRVLAYDRTAGKLIVGQAGTADSPLNDSDNADDLSALTFDVIVIGY
jgi:hypothetical protein